MGAYYDTHEGQTAAEKESIHTSIIGGNPLEENVWVEECDKRGQINGINGVG